MNVTNVKLKLSGSRMGRALLHLGCLLRGGKLLWHLRGIRRAIFSSSHVCLLTFGISGVGLVSAARPEPAPQGYYAEPFRPQFHFTPEKNWMNDPNGLVYYEGEYHLFYQYNPYGDRWGHMSWGHAISPDLVHWKHLPLALPEADGVMVFSGSAVVDWNNTSGFGQNGKPPLVAIYTGYNTTNNLQYQCIAYSNDKERTWTKYSGNPVINLNLKDFRDPKVQWYEPTRSWIMTVSLSTEHKVCFYGSADLKTWKLLSEFGPMGATGGVWECPDLFQLPVEGTDEKRWVLAVNIGSGSVAGGSGGQYFIGKFDGVRFTPDADDMPKPGAEYVPDGKVIADFEGETYGDWKVTGGAFGSGPAHGRLPNQNPVDGFLGHGLVNSFYNGDQSEGTLTSPEFEVTHPYLNFLIGGGSQKETCMNLLVDGKVVRTASGRDSERLSWCSWDVREFRGRKATLEIVDHATGSWGHISVDQIMLADAPARTASDPALWFDYGKDDYAAVSWSDIPKSDGRRLWLGWMSNWQYGQDVPTSPWRSAMTIPRELGLRKTAEGVRLVQKPVRELESLRDKYFHFTGGKLAEANLWLDKQHIQGQHLEIQFEIEPADDGIEGLKILKNAKEATIIGIDRDRRQVFVDRTQSGQVNFNPLFPGVHNAPLVSGSDMVKLHVFIDSCSVELFVNDGEEVFSDLVFPSADSQGLEFFGPKNSMKIHTLDVWVLKSIWN